jgi:predicted secreted protein
MNRLFIVPPLAALQLLGASDRGPRATDPAETIRARRGTPFRIWLRDSPGTGYTWHMMDSAASLLVLVDSGYYMSDANRKTDGGAGTRQLR